MSLPTIDQYPERYRYRLCPMDGTPLERTMKHGMERLYCPVCGWVFYPTPSIAATTIIEYQGGIVLARRALPPDAGIWHFPIGHAEFGESPEAAAAREAYEETGLHVSAPRFLSYTHSPGYGDPLMWYIVFGFACHAVSGELVTSDEVSELQVVPLEQVPELKWTSQQQALAAYRARK